METYTPGPWETGAGLEKANASLYVCAENGGDTVAEVVSGKIGDRNLIAAAPALLAGAKWALSNLAEPLHEWSAYARGYRALEAAIAKAEAK